MNVYKLETRGNPLSTSTRCVYRKHDYSKLAALKSLPARAEILVSPRKPRRNPDEEIKSEFARFAVDKRWKENPTRLRKTFIPAAHLSLAEKSFPFHGAGARRVHTSAASFSRFTFLNEITLGGAHNGPCNSRRAGQRNFFEKIVTAKRFKYWRKFNYGRKAARTVCLVNGARRAPAKLRREIYPV